MYFYIGKESDLHIVPRVHKQAGLKIHTIDSVDKSTITCRNLSYGSHLFHRVSSDITSITGGHQQQHNTTSCRVL